MPFPVAVQQLDESLLAAARHVPSLLARVLWFFTLLGNGWGLLLALPWAGKRTTRRWLIGLLFSQAILSGIVDLLKWAIARPRPCATLAWCTPLWIRSPGGYSFPSGHAAGAFAFAAFVTVCDRRFAVVVIPAAFAIALSRCVLGVHYPSDVAAGALLGAALGVGAALIARGPKTGLAGNLQVSNTKQ